MNKAKKISKEYADRNTCYANDSDLQYRLTRKAVEYGYNRAKEEIMDIVNSLKEGVGIGLCEYDAGYENGSWKIINKIIEKINNL